MSRRNAGPEHRPHPGWECRSQGFALARRTGASRSAARAIAALVTAGLGATGCGGDDVGASTHARRDSAGVDIVESLRPVWGADEGWTIGPEPDLVIGVADGDERYLLDRVEGVRRFADGRIAVLDVGSSRVRIYSETGVHLLDVGGPGEGPAEFDRPQFLEVVGDTIIVFQSFPPRITAFDGEGTFLGRTTIPSPSEARPLFGFAFGRFADGSMPVMVPSLERPGAGGPGRAREGMAVWRLTPDPPQIDSLVSVLGEEVIVHPSGGWNQVVFGRTTWYAADAEAVYLLETGGYDIEVRSREGMLRRIVRRPFEAAPALDEHRRRWVDQLVVAQQTDPERAPLVLRTLEEPGRVADMMPSARLLVVDGVGNLWVEDFDDVGVDQGGFSVFDPEGVWLGRVELPPGLPWQRGLRGVPLVIGDDWLLGVWTDALGVEEVRRYRIEKGG